MDRIPGEVNRETQALGITLVDVRLSRVELPRETSQAVFERMKTDRQREAAELRAQGAQAAQTIAPCRPRRADHHRRSQPEG